MRFTSRIFFLPPLRGKVAAERPDEGARTARRGAARRAALAAAALALMASPALAATIDFAPLAGELLATLAGILGTALAVLLVGVLTRLAARYGIEIEAARRKRLQQLIENGVRASAHKLNIALDGKLAFEVRQELIAETANYLAQQGATTVRKLGGDPHNHTFLREIVSGWAGDRLGIARPAEPADIAGHAR